MSRLANLGRIPFPERRAQVREHLHHHAEGVRTSSWAFLGLAGAAWISGTIHWNSTMIQSLRDFFPKRPKGDGILGISLCYRNLVPTAHFGFDSNQTIERLGLFCLWDSGHLDKAMENFVFIPK